ncbi:hypothetical protein J6TS2_30040 [Heyndrickxia sporothermodurans]|nr:hypothetical protein J6TS2_30040 [Heyndrickxia sporothermodurans]
MTKMLFQFPFPLAIFCKGFFHRITNIAFFIKVRGCINPNKNMKTIIYQPKKGLININEI